MEIQGASKKVFKCEHCNNVFTFKTNLVRHTKAKHALLLKGKNFKCPNCTSSFSRKDTCALHIKIKHPQPSTSQQQPQALQNPPSTASSLSDSTTKRKADKDSQEFCCEACDKIFLNIKLLKKHSKSKSHRTKTAKKISEDLFLIDNAFDTNIEKYWLKNSSKIIDPVEFLTQSKATIQKLMKDILTVHESSKMSIDFYAEFVKLAGDEKTKTSEFIQRCKTKILLKTTNLDELYRKFSEEIVGKVSLFQERESGWSLYKILNLELSFCKYTPLRGSSYIELPRCIAKKHAIINVVNNDNECFKWSVLAALHPPKMHPTRVSAYKNFKDSLKFDNLNFPMKISDITAFEKLNNISVNVFGLDEQFDEDTSKTSYSVMGPLHMTAKRQSLHCNLLYVQEAERHHFCYIKNLSR
jgi:hypothetical protein